MYIAEGLGQGVIGIVGKAIPVVAGLFGGKSQNQQVQDRLTEWAHLTTPELQYFHAKGGIDAQAADILLSARGAPFVAGGASTTPVPIPPASSAPILDLSKLIKMPEITTTSKVEIPNMVWIGLTAAAGVLLLTTLSRRR